MNEKIKYREIPRKHGFQKPFNHLQVLSWFIFAFNFCIYYLIIIPIFPIETKVLHISVLFIEHFIGGF